MDAKAWFFVALMFVILSLTTVEILQLWLTSHPGVVARAAIEKFAPEVLPLPVAQVIKRWTPGKGLFIPPPPVFTPSVSPEL